ncbi:methyl-accepting chemotaxis protein [Vibrio sp. SCSIO 43136]|uniref:methyl-accepting chemotaxis protein n=1 Tax=Vibrio sp. SCSIO 43136 TaxID=2819101 RepID=UPI002075A5C9|nr:methyl-accepting chemotaxis protein [Vibrio sp. SCSIO 43136]USD67823.1 hypothetical protein J4N39_16685 [Vibrio sp. SCSIO 43136]
MRKYYQSLGINGAKRVIAVMLLLGALLALLGFTFQAMLLLACTSLLAWRVLYILSDDQKIFSDHVEQARSGNSVEFDSHQLVLLHQLYPLLDDMVRLEKRKFSQVKSVSDQMGFSAQELANNSLEVAQHCQEQADATTTSASAATEISQSIDEVSGRIESTRLVMEESNQFSRLGKKELTQTQQRVVSVNEQVTETSQSMHLLDKELSNVVSMSRFIREIAEQTNLLALNAAIEAARAGEQGRGFSVVADEVRSLAQRSHESANAITNQVNGITSSMGTLVQQMEQVVTSTAECQQSVVQASTALENMLSANEEVTSQIGGIATASEQQAIASREISESMEQIAQTAERNAFMAQQNASVAEHLQSMAS